MTMTKYVIANWKSNKTATEVKEWMREFKPVFKQLTLSVQVVLCPSFVHLSLVHDLLPDLLLGTQTISPYPMGAYTGAVAASMIKEYAQYVILGHVERRQFFNETDQMVTNQALQTLDCGLTPILAVNDLNWSNQLSQLSNEQLQYCLVMYEPPESISTNGQGHPADLERIKSTVKLITQSYRVKGVLYGGSVSAANIQTYLADPSIDGVVPGNASLVVSDFIQLLKAIQ